MANVLQTVTQFANDHWATLLIGFLLVLFYWYVSMIFFKMMHYINCSLCNVLSTILRRHKCGFAFERYNRVLASIVTQQCTYFRRGRIINIIIYPILRKLCFD